ncbi:MAG: beta-propeller domain-containing protein, partial [Candidatus Hodarchaeales archaeon]
MILLGIILIILVSGYTKLDNEIELKKFDSCNQITEFIEENANTEIYYYSGMGRTATTVVTTSAIAGASETVSEDYSTTNIQVGGVDEADIVKNDGKYIYVVSGKKIVIVEAYPAGDAEILSETELKWNPQEIFINEDKLVVFGSDYQTTFIHVYNVLDKENPVLKRNITVDGYYIDSRMIGDYVYTVMNKNVYNPPIGIPEITYNGETKAVYECTDIYYFNIPDYSYNLATVMSINTQNDNQDPTNEVYLLGSSQEMFVSQNNIYITYAKRMRDIDYRDRMLDEVMLPL